MTESRDNLDHSDDESEPTARACVLAWALAIAVIVSGLVSPIAL